jgi:hypothetical protein
MLIAPRCGAPARHSGNATAFRALMFLLAAVAPFCPCASQAQTAADSSVTLLWTATGDDGTVGNASYYDIRYRTVGIANADTATWWSSATKVLPMPTPSPPGSTDSMAVRGLLPLTTYYFLVRVADEVPNWSGYSNLAVRTTSGSDVTAPRAITDLAVTSTTGISMSLRWTAPGDDGGTGTAASYDVRYSTSAITSANWGSAVSATGEPAPAAAGTQQTFTITGLNPSRTYYVAIRATDEASNLSALSNVPSGTTLDTIPPAPVRDLSLDPDSGTADPIVSAAEYEVASNAR